jgi:uncharacterized phiE125 gp8 family phage protein
MFTRVITAPAAEPITLEEAKAHLRVLDTDQDTGITAMIVAAREWAEQVTWRALITQTLEVYLDSFPCFYVRNQTWPRYAGDTQGHIVLPRPRLQSVTSVKYIDEDGDEQTLSSDKYHVDTKAEPGTISLVSGETWPTTKELHPQPVTVKYVAGYGDNASDVPQPIKSAMLLRITDLYEFRGEKVAGTAMSTSKAVEALLSIYSAKRFM